MLAVTRLLARLTTSGLARTTSSTSMSAIVASTAASLQPRHRVEMSIAVASFQLLLLLSVTSTDYSKSALRLLLTALLLASTYSARH